MLPACHAASNVNYTFLPSQVSEQASRRGFGGGLEVHRQVAERAEDGLRKRL